MTILVEHLFETAGNALKGKNAFGKLFEGRERSPFLRGTLSYDFDPRMKGTQNPKQFPNRLFFEVSSFDTNTMDVFS